MKYKYLLAPLFAGFVAIALGQSVYATPMMEARMSAAGVSLTSSSFTTFGAEGVNCAILPQGLCTAATKPPEGSKVEGTGIFLLLEFVLQVMTALVGIAAVGTLIYAGVLYSSAGGSNEQVAKSKRLITDTVIGIVVYALMFFALNWLIPGGVIG